jgi:hypothetical protein
VIPTWLQRQLETAGRWNSDGIGRSLTAGCCRSCKQPVVRGLDADVAGIPATCDPEPIDQAGELLALVAGRATYTVRHIGGRWQIGYRDHWRIKAGRPAAVLAEHRCGSPPLPAGPPLTDPRPRAVRTEEPTW